MGDLMPKRHHRASRELHPRRIHGVILKAALLAPSRFRDRSYSFQTVLPPTIVRTARPFSFHPSKGELRDADSNLSILTVHFKSGSIRVTSAGAPTDRA